jgi:hypothetical protein
MFSYFSSPVDGRPRRIWEDRDFVLQAVQIQSSAFQAASAAFRGDPEIAMLAVQRHGHRTGDRDGEPVLSSDAQFQWFIPSWDSGTLGCFLPITNQYPSEFTIFTAFLSI